MSAHAIPPGGVDLGAPAASGGEIRTFAPATVSVRPHEGGSLLVGGLVHAGLAVELAFTPHAAAVVARAILKLLEQQNGAGNAGAA